MKCVLEWLEETACAYSGKTAFKDDQKQRTFTETYENAKAIGSFLIGMKHVRKPVVVLIDKCCDCIDSMLGALYANCYYVVIDVHSPIERINLIVDTLENPLLIYNKDTAELANQITIKGGILPYEKLVNTVVDDLSIDRIRQDMIDMDIAYILFTSGSTGVPKGTVITHKSLIAYIDWVSKEFCFNENTIFGSQTPLYFSMSVTDLYSTIKCGCTFHIIPKALFVFPLNLIEFLNEMKINTIYWVPTALSILANWKAFDYAKPDYLKTIMFAGEVMPMKQLNYWIRNLPGVIFANLFGPTETTDICTFYKVNRVFSDNDSYQLANTVTIVRYML